MKLGQDEGFTLVELLVAVVILGIIVGSLGMALIVSFQTTDEASGRLERAHDVHISTAYFASDVQSASDVLRDAAPLPSDCGLPLSRLVLVWNDVVPSTPPSTVRNVVTYRRLPAPDQGKLVRSHCRTGSGVPGGPDLRTQTISHFVATDTVPQCVLPPAAPADCSQTPSQPREVVWRLTDTAGDTHTLRATRRVS